MPSEQDRSAVDRALVAERSWKTRFDSVLRQFNSLAGKPVFDKTKEQMVDIVGICQTAAGPMVQVIPTDTDSGIYSVTVEELAL